MLGIIGDMHWKPDLGYADFIKDRREEEKKEILDFIVSSFSNCDTIILLGDQLNGRTNSPEVIREFVKFIERFDGKKIYMIAGNHEKKGSGKSAIDFLGEIKKPNWTIITNKTEKHSIGTISAVFCPYFTKSELEVEKNEEAIKAIFEKLDPADILFHHHTMAFGGKIAGLPLDINQLPEPVLPLEDLQKNYKAIFGGHIHKPYTKFENAIVTGSVFNNEVGETQKYIWKIDETRTDDLINTTQQIALPGRSILKMEDPTNEELEKIGADSIVKVIITKEKTEDELSALKEKLKRFDAYILLERIPKQRKKMHYSEGESILEFNLIDLLKLYASEKNIPFKELSRGLDIIKE